jgi:hypothetical protein
MLINQDIRWGISVFGKLTAFKKLTILLESVLNGNFSDAAGKAVEWMCFFLEGTNCNCSLNVYPIYSSTGIPTIFISITALAVCAIPDFNL